MARARCESLKMMCGTRLLSNRPGIANWSVSLSFNLACIDFVKTQVVAAFTLPAGQGTSDAKRGSPHPLYLITWGCARCAERSVVQPAFARADLNRATATSCALTSLDICLMLSRSRPANPGHLRSTTAPVACRPNLRRPFYSPLT